MAMDRSVVSLTVSLMALVMLGCGEDAPAVAESEAAPADARALAEILDSDPTGQGIDDAVRAVDTRRPVMASGILANSAVPATRLQIDRIEALAPASPEGRTLRTRALQIHRARLTALEHYRDALSRGEVDDDALLDALHETSTVERDLLVLRDDLAVHAPRDEDPVGAAPGMPPFAGEDRPDDGDTAEEPTHVVEDPGVVEDALPEM